VRVHALTLFALPRTCEVTPRSPSWPTTLQPPCLGREPKAKVITLKVKSKGVFHMVSLQNLVFAIEIMDIINDAKTKPKP
jgi:hypothetical protein